MTEHPKHPEEIVGDRYYPASRPGPEVLAELHWCVSELAGYAVNLADSHTGLPLESDEFREYFTGFAKSRDDLARLNELWYELYLARRREIRSGEELTPVRTGT